MNDQFQWQWAASPVFFKSILKIDSKNANPVIYLRGIQHYEMESINAVYLSGRGKILWREYEWISQFPRNQGIVNRYWNECNGQCENNENYEPQAQTEQHESKKDIGCIWAAEFQCQDCERVFDSQPVLWYHKKSKNEGVKYGCNHCDYQATRQGHLTAHIQAKHEGVIMLAISVTIKLHSSIAWQDTFNLNMMVSSMLVISVTISLHSKLV